MRPIAVAGTVVIGLTVGACSSSPAPAHLPFGAVPTGTAQVTINDTGKTTTHDVNCTRVQSYTMIDARDGNSHLRAMVDNAGAPAVQSIYMQNLSNFSGSYVKDLAGQVKVRMVAQTYVISGVAEGFYSERPSFTAQGMFDIKVAC